MAIIDELGLQATVLISGHPAPEYPDTEPSVSEQLDPNTKKSHSYVQCTENAEFSIKFKVVSPTKSTKKWLADHNHAILFEVDIDGGKMKLNSWVSRKSPSHIVHGMPDYANGCLRKFRFTPVSTVDDASKSRVARDKELARNLGQIRIRSWRVVKLHTNAYAPRNQHSSSPLTGQIAEKALKGRAISHGTTLSPAVTMARQTHSASYKHEDPEASPLAVFYFKYRSADDLQMEMIIPRPRNPSPPAGDGEDDDIANLSKDEVERLARERLAELRGRKRSATVKSEDSDKVPRSSRPYKFIRMEGGKKAIDLTEDDDE